MPEQRAQHQGPPPAEGVELPEDRVSLSRHPNEERGGHPDVNRKQPAAAPQEENPHGRVSRDGTSVNEASGRAISEDENLDSESEEQVRELKQRDAEVKAHEQAHMAAGGGLVQGAASYTYEKGPDGGMYAVGGEVQIDTSPAKDPDQTIAKMQQVRRAALAPAQPSSTDRSVAAQASQVEAQARAEKAREAAEAQKDDSAEEITGAEVQPGAEKSGEGDDHLQPSPPSPNAAPAIQAYQAATTTPAQANQAFSIFA